MSAHKEYEEITGRDVSALLNPRPIVVATALGDAPEHDAFATVIWVTPLSHTPSLMAVALREKSNTFQHIRENGAFALCTLEADEQGAEIANYCGNNTGRTVDKGARIAHKRIEIPLPDQPKDASSTDEHPIVEADSSIELPIVEGAYAWIACTVESIQPAGDHQLIIGRTIAAQARTDRDESGITIAPETLLCLQHKDFTKASTLRL